MITKKQRKASRLRNTMAQKYKKRSTLIARGKVNKFTPTSDLPVKKHRELVAE